jgi:hypothetical protein
MYSFIGVPYIFNFVSNSKYNPAATGVGKTPKTCSDQLKGDLISICCFGWRGSSQKIYGGEVQVLPLYDKLPSGLIKVRC